MISQPGSGCFRGWSCLSSQAPSTVGEAGQGEWGTGGQPLVLELVSSEQLWDSGAWGKLGGTDPPLLRHSKAKELYSDSAPSLIANSFKAVLKGQHTGASPGSWVWLPWAVLLWPIFSGLCIPFRAQLAISWHLVFKPLISTDRQGFPSFFN